MGQSVQKDCENYERFIRYERGILFTIPPADVCFSLRSLVFNLNVHVVIVFADCFHKDLHFSLLSVCRTDQNYYSKITRQNWISSKKYFGRKFVVELLLIKVHITIIKAKSHKNSIKHGNAF